MRGKCFFLFLFPLFALLLSGAELPPVADLLLLGNPEGKPSKAALAYIGIHNPYSVWIVGGGLLDPAVPGKALPPKAGAGNTESPHKAFLRSFPYQGLFLAVLGSADFANGLHGGVGAYRTLRAGGSYVLDYIGAKNNENPFLLKYIDILVNGKTLRFMGLGAWEALLPQKKDVRYRRITSGVIAEMREYAKSLPKADFTILLTAQSMKYDLEIAGSKKAVGFFDLILSHDPAAPLCIENKGGIPVAGCGKHGKTLRKIFFNPVEGGVGGSRIQVWEDASYGTFLEKQDKKTPAGVEKAKEKK